MDTSTTSSNQRNKRPGRPSKSTSTGDTIETTPVEAVVSSKESLTSTTDVAALAISPTPEGHPNPPAIIPVSECRRSSRKKIIKFDVRDLLNKNRKPHKIQIEARIDSNVPSASKTTSATSGETVTGSSNSGLAPGTSGDLSSKQKTFLEKSAIFRRFSISQDQTKPPPPPPIPPMPPTIQAKVAGDRDAACSTDQTGKRINRTQEYYSNVMLKPKHTTSLIVAQMESKQRKSCNKADTVSESKTEQIQQIMTTQQKRRGRPPKVRQQEITTIDDADKVDNQSTDKETQNLTPEKATNWKEYKACLAQQSDNKEITESTNIESPKSIELKSDEVAQAGYPDELKEAEKQLLHDIGLKGVGKMSENSYFECGIETSIIEIVDGKTEINKQTSETNDTVAECINEENPQSSNQVQTDNSTNTGAKYVQNEEICTQMLSRESSLSESENSGRSSSLKLTENLSSENSLSKDDVTSPQFSPINKREENKTPAGKRSKRLQRKGKHMGNKQTTSCAEILNVTKPEDVSSEENIFMLDEPNISNVEANTINKETLGTNQLISSDNTNLETSKENALENINLDDRVPKHFDEKVLRNSKQSLADKLCDNIEIFKPDLEKIEAYNTPQSQNETLEESNVQDLAISPAVISIEDSNLGKNNQTMENILQTPSTEHAYAMELSLNEVNDQKQTNHKSKPKGTIKQRKSLRNQKESTKGESTYTIQENKVAIKEANVTEIQDSANSKLKNPSDGDKIDQINVLQHEQQMKCNETKVIDDNKEKALDDLNQEHIDSYSETVVTSENVSASDREHTLGNKCKESDENVAVSTKDHNIKPNAKDVDKNPVCKETEAITTIHKACNTVEKTTSAKRKSLRNQKDLFRESDEKEYKTKETEDNEFMQEPKDDCSPSIGNLIIEKDSFEVPKRKTRKSRFRNLHGPEENDTGIKNINEQPNIFEEKEIQCIPNNPKILEETPPQKEIRNITDESKIAKEESEELVDVPIAINESHTEIEDSTLYEVHVDMNSQIETKSNTAEDKSSQKEIILDKTDESNLTKKDSIIKDESNTLRDRSNEELEADEKSKEATESTNDSNFPPKQKIEDNIITNKSLETEKNIDTEIKIGNEETKEDFNSLSRHSADDYSTVNKSESEEIKTDEKQNEIKDKINKTDEKQNEIRDKTDPIVPSISIATTETSMTNAYVIQDVSIETNTLLDILRTVQSNEEAAQVDVIKQTNEKESECTYPLAEEHLKEQQLKKLSDSNSNSPARSKSASPLAYKNLQQISPCRSDTSSPSTLKKVTISPCRSDSSSPLTVNKKITRRYERRSRRGDEDSSHKTLEETFAEIAALSSKAVLEMTTNKSTYNVDSTNKITDDVNSTAIESSIQNETPNSEREVDNQQEKELEESIDVTPTRRTRQAKSRSTKVVSPVAVAEKQEYLTPPVNKEPEALASPIAVSEKSTETKIKDIDLSPNESSAQSTGIDSEVATIPQDTEVTTDSQVVENTDTQIPPNHEENDIPNNLQKEKAQELFSDQSQLDPKAETKIASNFEEECLTPKQADKRDSSQSIKSEIKSTNRKSTKKSKVTTDQIDNLSIEDKDVNGKTSITPNKRGRRTKTTTPLQDQPVTNITGSGKNKSLSKEAPATNFNDETEPLRDQIPKYANEVSSAEIGLPEKSLDEKLAKKKRQRKLKEAFEAALNDKPVEIESQDTLTPSSSPTFGINFLNKSPEAVADTETNSTGSWQTSTRPTAASTTQVPEPEEDPDPLKDIEKFIEDGVNLLKKGYKIEEDSVDNVIPRKTLEETPKQEIAVEQKSTSTDNELNKDNIVFNTFETPADTPLATPSVTPPPPETPLTSVDEEQTSGGVRRSHRIKLITKTPKALVGRGLVRDKERFSIKDDVETKSHYTLDDHLLDLAEVEAKNTKFLKDMEERLSNFQVIKENEYKCERVISREARKMICDCFLTPEEEERGELACGEDCLNRLLMIECGNECNVKERCTNKRFQKFLCSPCRVFRTEKKGFGIMADIEILPGEFIMEYVGEVINSEEFEKRRFAYSQEKNRHYYFMALRSDAIIDATIKGNISRFINHSCDPNAETQKWTVNGELRIGFFSRKSIMPGEEITFDYQYQRYGREAQRCYCESSNCRGWIGQEPNSDEGEQIDDEDESDDEEDEEDSTSNLLGEVEDDDSDASVSDPEEVQKRLEMAAAQAEAELAPISLDEKVIKKEEKSQETSKEEEQSVKPEVDVEDSKSKFKKLLSKMAEKVAAKHKQNKREQKLQRKKKSKESSSELANKQKSLEDPDIEDEVEFLSRCGLKTQSDTLRLSRLMVRAKLVQTRLDLLSILRKGELPCRRLFLDYHGLRLVHGWMSEDVGNMQIRLALLQTLELLPIANKTVLTDSKVMQVVRNWCGSTTTLSPNEDSQSSSNNSQDGTVQSTNISENTQENSDSIELQKLALKLITAWDGLPEIFRIPKKERIEQMKEHEREADRQYAETECDRYSNDQYRSNRFGRRFNPTSRFAKPHNSSSKPLQLQNTVSNAMRTTSISAENTKCLSKTQRREMFAAKVARDEAEKRMAEERREFETKCRFFGLDPKKTRPQDVPFCVNPATGQWYSVERNPISTPPSYAHVQVPVKPKSTNPIDYQLPAVCNSLPPQWKFAITPLGQIYYYHVQYRIPQWEPPTPAQMQLCCESNIDDGDSGNEHTPTTGPGSSDDDDDILIGMDAAQLKAYIDRKVEIRRQKRYQRLVDERAISVSRSIVIYFIIVLIYSAIKKFENVVCKKRKSADIRICMLLKVIHVQNKY